MHELKEMEIKHDMVRRKEKKNSEKQAFGHSSSQVWLEGHSSSHLLCVCISHTHIVTVLLGKFKFNVDCEILSACKASLILITNVSYFRWAVVLPCDSRNPTAPRKFELAIYPDLQV